MPLYTRRDALTAIGALGLGAAAPDSADASEPPKRTGGPHLRVGCCAYSYRDFLTAKRQPRMTLEDFLDQCADIGLDGVELTSYYFPSDLTFAYIRGLARRAYLLGLDVNSTAIGNNFMLPPGPERDRQIAHVKQWIDYAVDMGAPCARVFAGDRKSDTTDDQALAWATECLDASCEYAATRGVMLAMENHGNVCARSSDNTLRVVQAVPSDWFGLKWDTANFHTADPYADLTRCAPWAITTHIKTEVFPDGHRQPADYPRLLRILRDAGYRGYLQLEYEGTEDPSVAVPRALRTLLKLTR